jgi:hypothetical protein
MNGHFNGREDEIRRPVIIQRFCMSAAFGARKLCTGAVYPFFGATITDESSLKF